MEDLKNRYEKLLVQFDTVSKKAKISDLEAVSLEPSFWKDPQSAANIMRQLSTLQREIESIDKLKLLIEENNEREAQKILSELELLLYFSGVHDSSSCIVSLHAGQGGVEAMDWTQMLYRMYSRFCERRGYIVEVIDQTSGDEAGLKSITFTVDGFHAYGYLKREAGVHRLVRLSPFNADKLRQTSFALVEVIPQIEKTSEIEIRDEDLDWDFYRASSHGGQNVQKVSSAVRLKHKPTGITVTAQAQRYQAQNREYALKLLVGKLWAIREEERKKEEARLKGGYKTPGWGNQIRSYVLHPYKMVKDLRTGYETSDTDAVLDGMIDGFIEEEVRQGV